MYMELAKFIFNVRDYFIGIIYSFTFIDVTKKILFNEFYLSNLTNLVQLLATVVALFFGYFKLLAYIRDSRIKTKILEQELVEKQNANFRKKFERDFIYREDNQDIKKDDKQKKDI